MGRFFKKTSPERLLIDEIPDSEMEKINDEIQRAQETVEEMKKAVDALGLPQPPEPIPDEIIPNN